ncbi:hypothetical protein D6B98_15235 [Bradyrhizobium sp. LVM 105]|nr:hypothetical protein D6B98_15235 [Bradyrhizobium sp. LVM 105]
MLTIGRSTSWKRSGSDGCSGRAVLRDNVGEAPTPSGKLGLSEYGKQVFTFVWQILTLGPSNLMRARLTRRQNGRLGEFQAKDHATEPSWIRFGRQNGAADPRAAAQRRKDSCTFR